MTEGAFAEMMATADGTAFDGMDPANNSPLVAWLASAEAGDVTGRVIEVEGGQLCLEQGWTHGPRHDLGRRWDCAEVGDALRALIAQGAPPEPVYGSRG